MARCYLYFLGVFLCAVSQCDATKKDLEVLYEWKKIDYVWPSKQERHEAIKNGTYNATAVILWDIDVFYFSQDAKTSCAKAEIIIFATTPRIQPTGIPATVSTIEQGDGQLNPRLKPFPNWEYNRMGNRRGLINVYRMELDGCGRLWILDNGYAGNSYGGDTPKITGKFALHVFDDLESGGSLVGRYVIPESVLVCNSQLVAIMVDLVSEDSNCDDVFAYISDDFGNGLIVFSLRNETFARVVTNYFYPDPFNGNFDVSGIQFQFMDGVIAQSMSPIENGDRTVYFHPFTSVKQFYVKASILRDQQAFLANQRSHQDAFYYFPKNKSSQSAIDCMTRGVMLFPLLGQNAIACWNSQTDPDYTNTPIIVQNNTTLQFITGMKVFLYQFYVVSNQLQNYFFGQVSTSEINYRLLYGYVPKLVKGTACEIVEPVS